VLLTVGMLLYVVYTAAGFALLPVSLIKTAPSISSPARQATTAAQLDANRERQRQLERRCAGNTDALSSKDRRELDALAREERTLIRRQRLAEEAQGKDGNWRIRVWVKLEALLRPFKLVGGIVLLLVSLLVWVSMLLTAIDKARRSAGCQPHHQCDYLLPRVGLFNPLDWLLVQAARVFPVDYVLFALLVLLFFSSSVVGLAAVGIRFLWIRLFQIRRGHTAPQALLLASVLLMLVTLALHYALDVLVAPQYAAWGPQTFCDRPVSSPATQPDCTDHPDDIKPCAAGLDNAAARLVCTPSVGSTILSRITWAFPFFGVVLFWGQFVWLGECRLPPFSVCLLLHANNF
jgi:LMBR1 domain-containing protein 1